MEKFLRICLLFVCFCLFSASSLVAMSRSIFLASRHCFEFVAHTPEELRANDLEILQIFIDLYFEGKLKESEYAFLLIMEKNNVPFDMYKHLNLTPLGTAPCCDCACSNDLIADVEESCDRELENRAPSPESCVESSTEEFFEGAEEQWG